MRVLLIEDEADLADALQRTLVEEGYACDVAHDGLTGSYGIENWDYDLLILDLMLPGVDGRTLLRQVREQHRTPVLILTARSEIEEKVRLLDEGADDYLTKPFELSELLARVRSLIRRSANQPCPKIDLADVSLNLSSRVVTRAGDAVSLTAKEFSLLEYLALRRGEVVTQSDIYDHLYSEDEETASNVVAVYVANLRKKLGRALITTRRGEGYILDA